MSVNLNETRQPRGKARRKGDLEDPGVISRGRGRGILGEELMLQMG